MVCYLVDVKIVGFVFREVVKKYVGQKDVEVKLIQKVFNGGSGVWGVVVMLVNKGQVIEVEVKELVKWVLSLK